MKKINWFISIKWKIFAAFLLVGIVPLTVFSFTINSFIESYFYGNKENEIRRDGSIISDVALSKYFLTSRSKEDQYYLSSLMSDESYQGYRVIILDDKGIVINDTNGIFNGSTLFLPEIIYSFREKKAHSILQKDKLTLHTAVPVLNEDELMGTVLIISDTSDIRNLSESIGHGLILLTSVIMVIVILGVAFVSNIILNPLKSIVHVVNLMSEGHLNQRIEVKGNDEYTQLAIAFNNMNDKLEKVEKTREEFVSNVSHELKTPLSSIKVLSESILFQENTPIEMYKEFLQDINSEVDRMTMIVNDLLNLVKLDQRDVGVNIKPTDINKMIQDILKRLSPLAEQKSIEVLCEEVKKVTIDADEMKLSLAISNLVENGIKYTPDGGSVKVTIDSDHQNAFITVSDTGIGIAEEEQSKVFTRFYRVDKTRDRGTGGTGLGLSITHTTTLLHSGSIRLSSKEGEGTTFVVRLPIKQNV